MKLAILTSETPHHCYFVRELCSAYECLVVYETTGVTAPFETSHPFELDRDRQEWVRWFNGTAVALNDLCDTRATENINDQAAVSAVASFCPDALVVFGTRRIKGELLTQHQGRIFNLHGGDPEKYRGLDSHLWAIYHGDQSGIVTTLHHLNANLDDGDIIAQQKVPLSDIRGLAELRAHNTEACLHLTKTALVALEASGNVPSRPQRKKGRYYSFMPVVLKDICVRKFDLMTAL